MAYGTASALATTANINIGSPGGPANFDGFNLQVGTRVLLTSQFANPVTNGIWLWQGPAAPMLRPSDEFGHGMTLDDGAFVWVQQGSTCAGTCWGFDPPQIATVDTDSLQFTRVALPPVQVKAASTVSLPSLMGVTTIDGVPLTGNGAQGSDLVLLKDQSPATQNGIYWASPSGTMALSSEPLTAQRVVRVSMGTANANTEWALVSPLPVQMGTSPITFSRQFVRANVKDFGAAGNGTTDDSQAILVAVSSMVARGGALLFPPGVYSVTQPVTIPPSVGVVFEDGAALAPNGATVTIEGRILAHPLQPIFAGTGVNGPVTASGTAPPAITITGAPAGASQCVVAVGPLYAVRITNGGAGYTSPPQVTFSSPPLPGTPATGVATIAGGAVTGVIITAPGSGYTAAPTVTFSSGGGAGAAATAILATAGALGAMTFQVSTNGGTTWSAIQTSLAGSSYSYTVPGAGITITFSAGAYSQGNVYRWSSAAPVAITSLAAERFSVRWWGATGNGTSDDTASIDSAIAAFAAAQSATGSPRLYFPAGTYVISSPLSVNGVSGGVIEGDGVGASILQETSVGQGLAGAEAMFALVNCVGTTVRAVEAVPVPHYARLTAPSGSSSANIGTPFGGQPAPGMRCALIRAGFTVAEELTVLSYGGGFVTFTAPLVNTYGAGDYFAFGVGYGFVSYSNREGAVTQAAERNSFIDLYVGSPSGMQALRGFGASCLGGGATVLPNGLPAGTTGPVVVLDAGRIQPGQRCVLVSGAGVIGETVTVLSVNPGASRITLAAPTVFSYAAGTFLASFSDFENDSHVFLNCQANNVTLEAFGLVGLAAVGCSAVGCAVTGIVTWAAFGARYGGSWNQHGGTFSPLGWLLVAGGVQLRPQQFHGLTSGAAVQGLFFSSPSWSTQGLAIVALGVDKKLGPPPGARTINVTSTPLNVTLDGAVFGGDLGDIYVADLAAGTGQNQSTFTLIGCAMRSTSVTLSGVVGRDVGSNWIGSNPPAFTLSSGAFWVEDNRGYFSGGSTSFESVVGTLLIQPNRLMLASADSNRNIYVGDANAGAEVQLRAQGAFFSVTSVVTRCSAPLALLNGVQGDATGAPLSFGAGSLVMNATGNTVLTILQTQTPTLVIACPAGGLTGPCTLTFPPQAQVEGAVFVIDFTAVAFNGQQVTLVINGNAWGTAIAAPVVVTVFYAGAGANGRFWGNLLAD